MSFKRRLLAVVVMLAGFTYQTLHSGHAVSALDILVLVTVIIAALNDHRKRPFWLFIGIGLGAVLGLLVSHIRF